MFIDEIVVVMRSGKGGDGMVHFRREKYVPRGGPDGGDGGKGADVILEVQSTLNTLSSFRHRQQYFADDGKNGGPKNQTGRSGEDLIVYVPPGTIVYNDDTGELIGDLVEPGQQLIVCRGGRAGRGNSRFTNSINQVPRIAEKGEPAEEKNIRLELKLIADVGIVGVPNAGKSSLLAAVTNANPKIADYPFTTLVPNLGVAELDSETSMVLADIPGLIEGAHHGVGLGDSFLRHIQRTKVLIHVLDGLSQDPLADFSQINTELALFDDALGEKLQLVVLNKMDTAGVPEVWEEIKEFLDEKGYPAMAISALAREGLRPMLWKVQELLQKAPAPEPLEEIPVYRPEEDPNEYTIEREDSGWRVRGKAIERAASMTYWEHYGSVRRFQRMLEVLGIDKALRDAGIQEGDSVNIGEFELEWTDEYRELI